MNTWALKGALFYRTRIKLLSVGFPHVVTTNITPAFLDQPVFINIDTGLKDKERVFRARLELSKAATSFLHLASCKPGASTLVAKITYSTCR